MTGKNKEVDQLAQYIAEALTAINNRLLRIETWMLKIEKELESCDPQPPMKKEKKKT